MQRESPEWRRRGLVLSSCQEALTFLIRRGGRFQELPADIEERFEEGRSEESVHKLAESGVTLAVTNGHKAFGFSAEREDIESSIRFARRCHRHGIHVGTYIGETLGYFINQSSTS